MDLRNWEIFVLTGLPVVGASVEVREASLNHPNTGTILDSTVTDNDGKWEFNGLSDSPKDVKLTYQGKIKWIKGLAYHSVGLVIGEDFTEPDVNLLINGGFDAWKFPSMALGITPRATAHGWRGVIGAGDSGLVSKETAVVVQSSQYGLKIIYTKSSGPAYIYQVLPPNLIYAYRGKAISLSIQANQSVANSVQAFIQQDGVDFTDAITPGTGNFQTRTITHVLSPTANEILVGMKLLLSTTAYLDNAILVAGSIPGVWTPRGIGLEAQQVDHGMLDRVFSRSFMLG